MWQPLSSRIQITPRRSRTTRSRRTTLERLEERTLLSYTDFDLGSLLPANGGDGSKGFVVSGTTSYSELGGPNESLPVGDINQDGIDDLLVAAPSDVVASSYPLPQEYLIFGTRSGFPAEFNLSTLNGTAGYVIDGVAVGDHTGAYGGGGGDVNHDGIPDLILGAAPVDGVRAGQSYVIFGGSSNLTALDGADGSQDGRIKLTSLNGANGFTINGTAYKDGAGRITAAGDVNGDGVDDLLIGAINAFNGNGGAFVVFGRDSTHGALRTDSASLSPEGHVTDSASLR
jgi:hypothetical protein